MELIINVDIDSSLPPVDPRDVKPEGVIVELVRTVL